MVAVRFRNRSTLTDKPCSICQSNVIMHFGHFENSKKKLKKPCVSESRAALSDITLSAGQNFPKIIRCVHATTSLSQKHDF
jgi:hypothetical protein